MRKTAKKTRKHINVKLLIKLEPISQVSESASSRRHAQNNGEQLKRKLISLRMFSLCSAYTKCFPAFFVSRNKDGCVTCPSRFNQRYAKHAETSEEQR